MSIRACFLCVTAPLVGAFDFGLLKKQPVHGDLMTSLIRNAYEGHKAKLAALGPNDPIPKLVAAAQGFYEGEKVVEAISPPSESNFLAMTGIELSVGLLKLGNDRMGGCGVIPFHGHPNCYEVMTTINGTGAYAQLRSDGTVRFSRVMTPGDTWVMEQGAQHYYRNLDPNGIWTFEIAFTCGDVIGTSSHEWIRNLDPQLIQQFFKVDATAAADLARKPVNNPDRYIADCARDRAFHEAQMDADTFLNVPTKPGPRVDGVGSVDFYTMQSLTPKGVQGSGLGEQRLGLSIGRMTLEPGAMMYPALVYNGHNAIHVIKGKVLVVQWTYDNKLSSEIMEEYDLLIVLRGAIHFIINLGNEKAELYCHIDTPGKLADEGEYEPLISVAPNFFNEVDPRVIETVLQVSLETGEALKNAGVGLKLFGKFEGDLAVLLAWHNAIPKYCPLGCGGEKPCELDDNEHLKCDGDYSMPGESGSKDMTGLVAVLAAALGSMGAFAGFLALLLCGCILVMPACLLFMRLRSLGREVARLKEGAGLLA